MHKCYHSSMPFVCIVQFAFVHVLHPYIHALRIHALCLLCIITLLKMLLTVAIASYVIHKYNILL
jgi:hypothetical protein